MYLGSQAPLYQNVRLRCINTKTGKCSVERAAKNRVTRLMLWGISKFLSGEFNDSTPDKIYEYIPRYLALGTNTPGIDAAQSGVSTLVTVNDTRLLNEITEVASTGAKEAVKRISIQSRQHMKTSTRFTDPFVKLSLTMYVSSHQFDGCTIGEAGLFSKERDNNCVARVVFSPFKKGEDEVIEICWDITLLSYGTTKYPEDISIDEPTKVLIPLYYSPYFIRSTALNLVYIEETTSNGWLYLKTKDVDFPLFSINAEGKVEIDDSLIAIDDKTREVTIVKGSAYEEYLTEWKEYLTENEIDFQNVVRQLVLYSKKSGDNFIFDSSQTMCSMYLSEAERIIDSITFIADNEGALLQDNYSDFIAEDGEYSGVASGKGLYVSRIYKNEITYENQPTTYVIDKTHSKIVETNHNYTEYTIHNNQIYKLEDGIEEETGAYIENGYIMVGNSPSGYMYNLENGAIYKVVETGEVNTITSAFVVPSANVYRIYTITPYENVTEYKKYWIDWLKDKNVYTEDGEDTEYHITNDMFFATGDTHRLPYTITPNDATDRTVTWTSLNSNIAPVNDKGVVTGWNIGETYVTVSTTNGIKARTVIEVVKNLSIVKTTSVTVNPNTVTFKANSEDPQYTIVTAKVLPLSATYNTVRWTMDSNGESLFGFAPLKDNKVKVWLKNSTDVGRGYVIATTADGKSAKCLLQAVTSSTDNPDCPEPDHDNQHSS